MFGLGLGSFRERDHAHKRYDIIQHHDHNKNVRDQTTPCNSRRANVQCPSFHNDTHSYLHGTQKMLRRGEGREGAKVVNG